MKMEAEVEKFDAFVRWKNGDAETIYNHVRAYSVSENTLFLSTEWTIGTRALTGIPLDGVLSYDLVPAESELA